MLKTRVALITGASRGLGRCIARRLALEGISVAINYISDRTAAETLADEIKSFNGHCFPVQADVSDENQVRSMINQVQRELGFINILINNAGIYRGGDLFDFDYSDMDAMQRVNVNGLTYVTCAVAEGMKGRGFGRIVNLTSSAAYGTRIRSTTFYAATKAAVIALTRRFAMELGPYGITVNAVAPGFVVTDMSTRGKTEEEIKAFTADLSAVTMVRRIGRAEDIAHAIAFLASPESGFVTAQVLTVDGGRMDYIGHP